MYWNCNGISGKRPNLDYVLEHYRPDIFALAETKLIPSILDREICDGYTVYRLDRKCSGVGRGGGVLIGISESSNITVNNISSSKTGELLYLNLSVSGFSFMFAVYYRRPSLTSVDDFIEWYHTASSNNQLIVGDFNLPDISWPEQTLKNRNSVVMCQSFLNLLNSSDLEQKISTPTHNRGNILDLVLTNLDISAPVIEPSCSDHSIILFDLFSEFPVTYSMANHNTSPFWCFRRANLTQLCIECHDLDATVNSAIQNNVPINSVYNIFKTALLKAAHNNIPTKRRVPRPNPWVTKKTKREIARRRRWHRVSIQYPTEGNLERVKQQSKYCKKLVNSDYNSFINGHICNKLEGGNTKPLFKFISNRRGNSNTIKRLDGCSSDSPSDLAECFADAFSSVFTIDDGHLPNFAPRDPEYKNCQISISPKGVLNQLKSLDQCKGAGPDGLSPSLLRFLSDLIYHTLANIFSYSLITGGVPDDWRTAQVLPIYKKGSRSNPLNYRPVSLTSILSKLMEHIICHNINNYLDSNNILSESQHGFRKNRGCDTQLLATVNDFVDYYDSSLMVDVAVLDFSKAFDVVSHPKLLSKMKAIDINSTTCSWISGWLNNRTLAVRVNGSLSSERIVTSGVPQGSVLGPLLFLLFINDMPSVVSENCKIRLFADDSLVYQHIQCQSDADQLQLDLDNLANWADTWQMKFNVSKCEHMSIVRQPDKHVAHTYKFNDTMLKDVDSIKYLGVNIDNRLSFDNHIQEISKKATNILHLLMRNLKKAKSKTKTIAYKTICRPILEYASHVWSPHKQKHIKGLEALNRKAYRWANGIRKFDHITDLMNAEGWQPLCDRRAKTDLKLYFKIITGQAALHYDVATATLPTSYNTRVGAIRGNINTDVKRFGFKHRVYNILKGA